MYQNDCYEALVGHLAKHVPARYEVLAFRLFLKYLESEGVPEAQTALLRKKLRNRKSNPDMYVPSTEELLETLRKLTYANRVLYCVYLCSGLRKTEGAYLCANLGKLKIQQASGYTKITLNTVRRTKSAYFCYIPTWLYELLRKEAPKLSVRSLDNYITRNKLIGPKYARKWFYTKCIELGVPESIADFYEGRVSTSIGANHYLAKQALADKYYGEVLQYNLDFFKNTF